MKIEVGFPRRSFMRDNAPAGSLVLFESAPAVEVDVYVHNGLDTDDITPNTPHLKLVYQEKFDIEASFGDISKRAIHWAESELKKFISDAS